MKMNTVSPTICFVKTKETTFPEKTKVKLEGGMMNKKTFTSTSF